MFTLVDQGEGHAQAVGDGGGAFGAACVRADDDCLLVVGDVLLDVALQQRADVEVVDWPEWSVKGNSPANA